MLDIKKIKKMLPAKNRYENRIKDLENAGIDPSSIKMVIDKTVTNIENGLRSFVIYGEPQSGKTEMMIALTGKLLDLDFKIVIILMNDSVQLLGQNLERFQRSGLSPSPKKFSEILTPDIHIRNQQWVIFCKKNSKDLQKLLTKIEKQPSRAIIDDEADYATPNSKINKREKSCINNLTENLIGKEGTYIGVTATPARLDLNRTHHNQKEHWIDFPPHAKYTGQDVFFPVDLKNIPYMLSFLPEQGDNPAHIRNALFSFIVNVAYLNTRPGEKEKNYSILIHTSSRKADHSTDYKNIVKLLEALKDDKHKDYTKHINSICEIATNRYKNRAETLLFYILNNIERNNIVVMNSDKEVNVADNRTATDPTAPFTIVIGGNIISRGVTFNNLLSMFFTRDVQHKLQQDTYIQRARMFGARGGYLKFFELKIPKYLFLDWQKCFIFHRLSLESRKQIGSSPVWLDGDRVSSVSASSIDKSQVLVDKGEMSFEIFDYNKIKIESIILEQSTNEIKLTKLSELLGNECLPNYLLNFIYSFCPSGSARSIAIHLPKSIEGYSNNPDIDKTTIFRRKGFIGEREMEVKKFPDAIHHINILYNKDEKARVFYKYKGSVRFLKTGTRR